LTGPRPGRPSAPAAILLDALGTLVELRPPAPLLRAELARRFGVLVSEREAERAIAAEIAYYRAHLNEGRDPASLAALRSRCAQALRAALPGGEQIARIGADALTQALLASLRFSPFPDVLPALSALRRGGHRIAVVSNWDVSLRELLAAVGIAPLLDGIVTSAETGAGKPDTAIFERALGVVRAAPRSAIHVGDSLEEDVAGARRAGIEPVLIRRTGGPAPAGVRTISSLSELQRMIPLLALGRGC
jgi:putative hydrolase of the HAD superfamily